MHWLQHGDYFYVLNPLNRFFTYVDDILLLITGFSNNQWLNMFPINKAISSR